MSLIFIGGFPYFLPDGNEPRNPVQDKIITGILVTAFGTVAGICGFTGLENYSVKHQIGPVIAQAVAHSPCRTNKDECHVTIGPVTSIFGRKTQPAVVTFYNDGETFNEVTFHGVQGLSRCHTKEAVVTRELDMPEFINGFRDIHVRDSWTGNYLLSDKIDYHTPFPDHSDMTGAYLSRKLVCKFTAGTSRFDP